MKMEDVPLGWLVIAVRVEGVVYCLCCRESVDGEPLTENDVMELQKQGGMVRCGACGEPFFSEEVARASLGEALVLDVAHSWPDGLTYEQWQARDPLVEYGAWEVQLPKRETQKLPEMGEWG